MAGLQGRSPLRRVIPPRMRSRARGAAVAISLMAAAAVPLRAQIDTAAVDSARHTARPTLDLDLRLAEMASRPGPVGGARALIGIAPGVRIGAGGHQVLRRLDDVPSRTGPDRTLAFGYAGAVFEFDLPLRPATFRALVGAGTATVRDRFVGTRIGSDVLGVVEPELVFEVVRRGSFAVTAGAGYRFTFSVDGPVRLSTQDLASPFLSASLRIGPL